jgi:chromosome segregation ATPase
MDEIKPLTDEEIRDRFTNQSIEMVHVKTQFDHLLQSFQIYVNLESKLDDYLRRLESLEKSSNSSVTAMMEYSSKIEEISSRLNKLEADLQKEEQEFIYPENPIPAEE